MFNNFSIGDNLKAALKQMWDSKEFGKEIKVIEKPHFHADLNEKGHFQASISGAVSGTGKVSVDLPGGLDGLAVTAVNAAAELGNLGH